MTLLDARPHVELISDPQCLLGENPLWHSDEQALYWTDIEAGRLYRYDARQKKTEVIYEGLAVGGFTFQKDGTLLLFMERGAVRVFQQGKLETILESLPLEEGGFIFNDVIADPLGAVFCGTKVIDLSRLKTGRVYRLNTDASIHLLFQNVECSNGFGFSNDQRTLFFTDSLKQRIYRFRYDKETGAISHRTVFVAIGEQGVTPDGLTVDSEDHVWSAMWGAGCIVRYSPLGVECMRIELPALKVSSLTFGGKDCDEIYVTTAGGQDRTVNGKGAGAVFRIRAGIVGLPEFRSEVLLTGSR